MAGGTKYANIGVRKESADRIEKMEQTIANQTAAHKIPDILGFKKQLQAEKVRLEGITPPDTTGEQKDRILKRMDLLSKFFVEGKPGVVPPKPSEYQEWNVPTGSVGQKQAHSQFWKTHNVTDEGKIVRINPSKEQPLSLELKDLDRTLRKEQEEYDPDVANLDQFTPKQGNASLIDMKRKAFVMPSVSDEKLDEIFGEDRPLTDVQKKLRDQEAKETVELLERVKTLEAQLTAATAPKKKPGRPRKEATI